jgi:hypothetical protein
VKARLLALARDQGEEFNSLLTRYVLERFLHRLAASSYVSSFLLKGALLFTVWSQKPHRATRDIDLLGYGSPDLGRLRNIFCDICAIAVEDDGLRFDGSTVQAEPIREAAVQTQVPVELPTGLTAEFSASAAKLTHWKAFVGRTRLAVEAPSLTQAADIIAALMLPVFQGLAERDMFTGTWPAGGPWRFDPPSKNPG